MWVDLSLVQNCSKASRDLQGPIWLEPGCLEDRWAEIDRLQHPAINFVICWANASVWLLCYTKAPTPASISQCSGLVGQRQTGGLPQGSQAGSCEDPASPPHLSSMVKSQILHYQSHFSLLLWNIPGRSLPNIQLMAGNINVQQDLPLSKNFSSVSEEAWLNQQVLPVISQL